MAALDDEPAAAGGDCRRHAHAHLGALERGDVAPFVDGLRGQPRVRWKAIVEAQLLGIGDVGDVDLVRRRSYAVGFDQILHRRGDVEEPERVPAGELADSVQSHGEALPARRVALPNEQLDFIGLEAAQVRGDEEVAAPRHGDVPRLGADRVRLRDMFAVPWHEHEPHAVAEGCRPEQRDEQRDADDAGENAGAHMKLALVDVPPIVDAVHALERRARQMRE